MKVIIIDDEEPARNNLKQIIKDNFKDVLIIGEADSVKTGVKILSKITPDVLFLDVNLMDGSGFNILEQINKNKIDFHVIFITAYDTYAIKAFQFNALDYILKPIEINQLKKALEKAQNLSNDMFISKKEFEIIINNYEENDNNKKLAIRETNKISFVPLKDIVRCQADINYTRLFFKDGSTKVVSKSLKIYENQLPDSMFYRVHQSDIINLNYVKEFVKNDGGYLILHDGTEIKISRRRKTDFLQMLKQRFS